MRARRTSLIALFATTLLAAGAAWAQSDPATDCFAEVVTALSDDLMEGRGPGTEGIERAAALIVERLASAGLDDPGDGYSQRFDVTVGVQIGSETALSWEGGSGTLNDDFIPLPYSESAAFEGEVVFAGYGITAEPLGYDDYDGLDVTGKIVLAMRFEPGEADEESPFEGRRPTRWSDMRYKAHLAREAGAAAIIFVTGPGPDGEEEPDRLAQRRARGLISNAGLPVMQVTRAVAEEWLAGAGEDLADLQRAIDGSYSPRSVILEDVVVSGTVAIQPTTEPVRNLLGVRRGRGALADEVIVVGAHYDHLGYGGAGSRAPDSHDIHNGADDNASGVAAILCAIPEIVAELARDGDQRTLLVMAFTAEEMGLGGSGYYVEHATLPIEDTVAMVNLDMVGRVRESQLSALGTDSSPAWEPLVTAAAERAGLTVTTGGDGYGPSDQTPFFDAGVPVVHLFSGSHEEYHTPADDALTLNMEGGGQVTRMLRALLVDLVEAPDRPAYVRADSGPAMAGDSRGYGAYLGSIPDYTAMMGSDGGVLLSGVRQGGPAAEAGIVGGDRIVGFAGTDIENLYDLTYALQDHRPGETVEITVERGGESLTLAATLRSRQAASTEAGSEDSPHGSPQDDATSLPTSMPSSDWAPTAGSDARHLLDAREVHLADLRQLTFGGENAEGYFSPDGRQLIFQRTPPEGGCDQQYLLDLTSGQVTPVSSGLGRTTCGYFSYPDGERLIYSTTEHVSAECPEPPDRSAGYVWPLYDFDLVWQDGVAGAPEPFLATPAYDAEATACMVDGRIVFTSTRNGDLDLYVVNPDGSDLRQMTDLPGYDGGAFFSHDCSLLVWRASRPEGDALAEYRELLERGLVRPGQLDIFVMNADGSQVRQLTDNDSANFGPYPMPDNSGVVYSSNAGGSVREFDLWRVGIEGDDPEQITFTEQFDGFPMFSPDGQWFVFASNRGATDNQTNLFIARWVP